MKAGYPTARSDHFGQQLAVAVQLRAGLASPIGESLDEEERCPAIRSLPDSADEGHFDPTKVAAMHRRLERQIEVENLPEHYHLAASR